MKMRIRPMWWTLSLTAWFVPMRLLAQDTVETKLVRIRVRDVRTLAAISQVELFGPSGEVLGRADSSGAVRVRIRIAPFDGQLRRVGYVPSSVHVTGREAGDSVVVLLAPSSARTLGTVEVKTNAIGKRFADFDRRRLSGGPGIFLTDSAVMKAGHIRLTDLFRRFPSLYVWDSAGTYLVASGRWRKPTMVAIPNQASKFDLAPCVLQVVVDDVRMPDGFDLDMLERTDIHGIEIYPGPATIPPEYKGTGRNSMCGMISVWTKAR